MHRPDTMKETKDFLERLYEGVSGHGISMDDMNLVWEKGGSPMYGEITFEGVTALFDNLSIPIQQEDVFYDLGSGVGKMCVQVLLTTPIKKSVGIELSQSRHQHAVSALKMLRQEYSWFFNDAKNLEFIEGNFLDVDLSDATIVFLCSYSYSHELMTALAAKLKDNCKRLKVIISGTRFPEIGWPLADRLVISYSWVTSSPVYIYHNPDKPEPIIF